MFGEVTETGRLLGGAMYLDADLVQTRGGANDGNTAVAAPRFQGVLGAEWDTPFLHALTLTGRGIYAVTYRPSKHRRGAWRGSPVIDIDMRDGRVLQVHVPGQGTAGDVIMDLQMPLHSGELLGLPGRILVCVAGIAVALLSVTGVLVWWRKRRASRQMRHRRALRPLGKAAG